MNNSERKKTYKDFLVGNALQFKKYGVTIEIRAGKKTLLKDCYVFLMRSFPKGFDIVYEETIDHFFEIKCGFDNTLEFYSAEEMLFSNSNRKDFFDSIDSKIRITVAEFAVGKVFLHAGVVGWKGKAIVIPATSFSGKTTLVAELVKSGAVYYSDEYAVLDAEGNVEPFPKWLSVRGIISDFEQLDMPVESFRGIAGELTIPVGMILFSCYKKGRKNPLRLKPSMLTKGQTIMEILPHTLPIRNNPKFVLEVLNKLLDRAIIVKTFRGEAIDFAKVLLNYIDLQYNNY